MIRKFRQVSIVVVVGWAISACIWISAQPANPTTIENLSYIQETTDDPIGSAFSGIYNSEQPAYINYWPPLLYVIVLDFNQDGLSDLLVSANYYENGKAGEIWYSYMQTHDGFVTADGPVVFHHESAILQSDPGTKTTSIFDVHKGAANEASLIETRFNDHGIERLRIRQYDWEHEADVAHWESIREMGQPVQLRTKKMNFGPLMDRYGANINGNIHDRTIYMDGPNKDLPIDYRHPGYSEGYIDSIEEIYALLDVGAPTLTNVETATSPEPPADGQAAEATVPLTKVDEYSGIDRPGNAAETTTTVRKSRTPPVDESEAETSFWLTSRRDPRSVARICCRCRRSTQDEAYVINWPIAADGPGADDQGGVYRVGMVRGGSGIRTDTDVFVAPLVLALDWCGGGGCYLGFLIRVSPLLGVRAVSGAVVWWGHIHVMRSDTNKYPAAN